jgi:hypothetical protein
LSDANPLFISLSVGATEVVQRSIRSLSQMSKRLLEEDSTYHPISPLRHQTHLGLSSHMSHHLLSISPNRLRLEQCLSLAHVPVQSLQTHCASGSSASIAASVTAAAIFVAIVQTSSAFDRQEVFKPLCLSTSPNFPVAPILPASPSSRIILIIPIETMSLPFLHTPITWMMSQTTL